MITMVCTMIVKPGTKKIFLDALKTMVPLVRAEDGCISYGGFSDLQAEFSEQWYREDRITIIETWRDEEALRAHWKAPHMDAYRKATRDLVASKNIIFLKPEEP